MVLGFILGSDYLKYHMPPRNRQRLRKASEFTALDNRTFSATFFPFFAFTKRLLVSANSSRSRRASVSAFSLSSSLVRPSLLPSPVALPLLSVDPGFPPRMAASEDPGFSPWMALSPASLVAMSVDAMSPLGETSATARVSPASSDALFFSPPVRTRPLLTASLSDLVGSGGAETDTYRGVFFYFLKKIVGLIH